MVYKAFIIFLSVSFLLLIDHTVFGQQSAISVTDQGLITIQADDVELKKILAEFNEQHSVLFTGLSSFLDTRVTLESSGSLTKVVRKLLKTINVQNSAFIFNGDQLVQVAVLPAPSDRNAIHDVLAMEKQAQESEHRSKKRASVVMVKKILPDSQAESIQLAENDFIIAYNGQRTARAKQLVELVKNTKQEDFVTMAVVRDESILEFSLNGGMIGVQIVTIPMNFQVLERYYNDLGM